MIERNCLFCSAVFSVRYASDRRKYCSLSCAGQAKRTCVERECEHCGKKFRAPPSKIKVGKGRFCSKACYEADRKLPPHTCQICGAVFYPDRNRVAKGGGKFCSDGCKRIGSRKSVERICPTCGKTFLVPPSRIKFTGAKYCSIQCRAEGARAERATCTCELCGQQFDQLASRAKSSRSSRFCSRQCFYDWQSEYRTGERAPVWYGGVSFEPYPPTFNRTFKAKIRRRDSYTCAICGKTGVCVHHIDYDKKNTVPENCITLCRSCHQRITGHRGFWEQVLSGYLRTEYANTSG